MEEKDDKKINFPQGIYGEPAIPSRKLSRSPNFYGQIYINKKNLIDYLNTIDGTMLFLDMFKQKKNPRKLTFLVVEQKK